MFSDPEVIKWLLIQEAKSDVEDCEKPEPELVTSLTELVNRLVWLPNDDPHLLNLAGHLPALRAKDEYWLPVVHRGLDEFGPPHDIVQVHRVLDRIEQDVADWLAGCWEG